MFRRGDLPQFRQSLEQLPQARRNPIHPGLARNGGKVALAVETYCRGNIACTQSRHCILEAELLGFGVRLTHKPEVDSGAIGSTASDWLAAEGIGCTLECSPGAHSQEGRAP